MDSMESDTTQSDEFSIPDRDMRSYLVARDPSIISYHQRPVMGDLSQACVLNLESALSKEIQKSKNTVKVYLRMKPFLTSESSYSDWELSKAYEIVNDTTLMTRLPKIDNNATMQKKTKCTDVICKKYIFTKTFDADTTQLKIFEEAIKSHMINFLKGVRNSVIMTYGTSNSGKSYTLRGNNNNPGIIPRGLEFVFKNVTASEKVTFKPVNYSDVIKLNISQISTEKSFKESLLSHTICTKSKNMKQYADMQKILESEAVQTGMDIEENSEYSLWVSFAEIYNESVYDLLSYMEYQNKYRKPLNVTTDSKGQMFIKDLKMVNVTSGAEAFQVFMAGQYHLKIAATGINAQSSRSHSIFTIKMLKYRPGCEANQVVVSTFSFCDLAGSERLNKTLNVGDRLKEAQNINTSLLVLSRCLKSIYDYQTSQPTKKKNEVMAPFRESKLTRLFQNALSGKEHIALIVNINPIPELYIETHHVLKFSAIAKKIVQEPKPVDIPKPTKKRFSMTIEQSRRTQTDWDDAVSQFSDKENETKISEDDEEVDECTYINKEDYYRLVNENAELKKQISKNNHMLLKRDMETRAELINMYTEMINKKDEDFKKRLEEQEARNEEYMAWRETVLQDHFEEKLKGNDTTMIEELQTEVDELSEQCDKLIEKNRQCEARIENLQAEKESLAIDLKHAESELQNCKQLLQAQNSENDSKYIDELKSQLSTSEERIKKLQSLLDDAKSEFLELSTYNDKLQHKLAEQEMKLQNNLDKINDLEEQLELVRSCSASKTVEIEQLETKVEKQTKLLIQKEICIDTMQKELDNFKSLANTTGDDNKALQKQLEKAKQDLTLLKEVNNSNVSVHCQTTTTLKDIEELADFSKKNQQLTEIVEALEKGNKTTLNKLVETNKTLDDYKEEVCNLKIILQKKEDEISKLKDNHSFIINKYETTLETKTVEILELQKSAKKQQPETPSISTPKNKKEPSSVTSKISKDDENISDDDQRTARRTVGRKRTKKTETQPDLVMDDEAPRRCMTRNARKRAATLNTPSSVTTDDVNTISVTSTDSKKKTKKSLAPPRSTEPKRPLRKALFHEDETDAIDLCESIPGSPLPIRSLRKRRK